jgi:hypothetical protein
LTTSMSNPISNEVALVSDCIRSLFFETLRVFLNSWF